METTGVILYAEDDENDVFLMQRAFKQAGVSNPLLILPDGQAIRDFWILQNHAPQDYMDPETSGFPADM